MKVTINKEVYNLKNDNDFKKFVKILMTGEL